MRKVFVGEADALRRELYKPIYENGKLTHYEDENRHRVYFYLDRKGNSMTWSIFRERHDAEGRNDEMFSSGAWKPTTLLYGYIHDARVEEDVTFEEVIKTAVEIDKALTEYARQNNQETTNLS